MTKLFEHNGLKTAVINTFIDPENGFLKFALTDAQGGALYVPGGEDVSGLMGDIITESRGSIFVIGQDYHPGNHISFMINHPGVMAYRVEQFKKLLDEHDQPHPKTPEELYEQAQQPVHFFNGLENPPINFPFPEVVLDENRDIIGLKEATGVIREVRVKTSSGLEPHARDRGRVEKVLDSTHKKTFDEYRAEGRLLSTQMLWTKHCVQGTESCLYPSDMALPEGLVEKLSHDLAAPYIYHHDENTGNEFYVIRKGQNPEIDSYGIGLENDLETYTPAMQIFAQIAKKLKSLGCEQVQFNVGGLATNFCVEYSINNIDDFLAGQFKMRGLQTTIKYVPEISRGIPLPVPPENPFSLEGASARFAKRGVDEISVQEIINMVPAPVGNITYDFGRLTPNG